MATESISVLIVEDDPDIGNLVEVHLKEEGFVVDRANDGLDGYEKASRGTYALIILDLMLPGLSGMEICKRLRAEKKALFILMLTAKSEELDKVLGLEFGADDYVTKPFSIRELVARVRAILRRTAVSAEVSAAGGEVLRFGRLQINIEKRRAELAGEVAPLTAKEFELLAYLAQHPGRPFTREQLLSAVWGYQYEGYEHTVNSHINRLRAKIEENAAEPAFILTVWGVGYRFAEAHELT